MPYRKAGIAVSWHVALLFGTPQGSPRTDKLIAAAVQTAERIVRKISCRVNRSLG
jgi:hypothetical protein